jgi:hypothetical protein
MCGVSSLYGDPIPNTIYISCDGISRATLFALLQKKALPNLERIMQIGNVRNMEIDNYDAETLPSYVSLLTGYTLQDFLSANKYKELNINKPAPQMHNSNMKNGQKGLVLLPVSENVTCTKQINTVNKISSNNYIPTANNMALKNAQACSTNRQACLTQNMAADDFEKNSEKQAEKINTEKKTDIIFENLVFPKGITIF